MSTCAKKGALCGRGEMSMHSFIGPGEDEGRGGVVVFSAECQLVFCAFSLVDHAYAGHPSFRKDLL
jgi:hypothetical protein